MGVDVLPNMGIVRKEIVMSALFLKIISGIVSAVTSVVVAFAPITEGIAASNFEMAKTFDKVVYENQLVPELDEEGWWTFNTDRALKIVQLTDIHIGGGIFSKQKDSKALNAVAAMLTYEKPDLVILTGDMVYPVPLQSGTANNSISTKMLITLMEQLGVYYTVCFGNHDSEFYATHTREQVSDMWADESLKYSLYQAGPKDVDGYGNQIIKVKNSDGIVTNAYFVLDSHDYTEEDVFGIQGKYDNVHENQVQWYEESVLKIDKANKAVDEDCAMFPSLLFLHIPLFEYETAWRELKANGYQDTENVKLIDGWYHENNEKVCHGVKTDNLFETMLELGSTKAIFCGHDHTNNAVLEYKGIRMVYGMSVDYLAYIGINSKGSQRGCTVIGLTQNGELSVSLENYYQDKYESKYEKENITMQW